MLTVTLEIQTRIDCAPEVNPVTDSHLLEVKLSTAQNSAADPVHGHVMLSCLPHLLFMRRIRH